MAFAELNMDQEVDPIGDISDLTKSDNKLYKLFISNEYSYEEKMDRIVEAYHGSYCYSVDGGDAQSYASEYEKAYSNLSVKKNLGIGYKYDGDKTKYYQLVISGGKIEEKDELAGDDDDVLIGWGDNGFYYATDVNDKGEGDIYCWNGTEEVLAAKDANTGSVMETPDGLVFSDKYNEGDLYIYTKDGNKRIGKDISYIASVSYVDSKLIFYKDEDDDL